MLLTMVKYCVGIPSASSITHQHLAACIASEMKGRQALSIVDVGCGGGALVTYFRAALPQLTQASVTVDGFDVSDFAPHGNSNLGAGVKTVRTGEPWPYADHSLDVIVSNQVLEHVFDQSFFFHQIARCLKPDGVSIHLFPLRNVIYEDHVGIPLAHRIPKPGWIRLMAKVGFYSPHRANALPDQSKEFGQRAADYVENYTIYVTRGELKRLGAAAGLRVSFDYTPRMYGAKLRALQNKDPIFFYPRNPAYDRAAFWLVRYVASITLVLRAG